MGNWFEYYEHKITLALTKLVDSVLGDSISKVSGV